MWNHLSQQRNLRKAPKEGDYEPEKTYFGMMHEQILPEFGWFGEKKNLSTPKELTL
jgi:hypothetical protein